MRTKNIASIILATGMALVSFTSCQERLFHFTKGEGVKFTAGSAGLWTKAYYEDVSSPVAGQTVPIYWEEGDLVRIFCEECGSPEIGDPDSRFADYVVIGFERDDATQAHLAQQTETILRWGSEDTHNFYAVYPTPDVSDGISYFPSMTQDKDKLKLTASVPKTIAAAQAVGGVIKADFMYQYLLAKTSVEGWSGDNEGVFLKFKPVVTAIDFTIQNGTGNELDIVGIALESAGHNISGTFTADLAGWDTSSSTSYPPCTSGDGEKTVQLSFAGYDGGHIALANEATLNFTMFMAPCSEDVNDITFKVYKSDGTWVSTKLAYNDAAKTGVSFPNHKMTYVTGLLVPNGAQWTVKYSADVNYWTDDPAAEKDPMPELKPVPFVTPWEYGYDKNTDMLKYNYALGLTGTLEFGHEGASSTITITSKRELFEDDSNHIGNGTYTSLPVIWHLEYWDVANNRWAPAIANVPIKCDGVDFLTLNPVYGTGENVEIELLGDNDIAMTVAAAPAPTRKSHDSILQGAAAKGTSGAPYNLAMYDIYGNARENAMTANSYVINAPGWYAFPLVYGNGLNFESAPAGGVFTPAYNPGGELPNTPTFLSKFYNGKGKPIISPYIDQDLEETALTGWSVFPLWQDAALIADDACSILNPTQAAGKGLKAGNCSYVMFEVKAANLTQGNAVIAVKDAAGIVWSWHIWVTDRDLTCTDKGMMPFSLGWVDSDCSTEYKSWNGASVRLRAVQDASGVVKEFTVSRRAENEMPNASGNSPYWQWGRKDPFKGSGTISFDNVGGNIAYSINNPDKYISKYNSWYYQKEMVETTPTTANYLNLWSATNSGEGTSAIGYSTKPVKTIYDPCPPGFQVPQGNAFTGWSSADMGILRKLGNREYNSGNITESGTKGYYWTAVPKYTGDSGSILYKGISIVFNGSSIQTDTGTPRVWSWGHSILPAKE